MGGPHRAGRQPGLALADRDLGCGCVDLCAVISADRFAAGVPGSRCGPAQNTPGGAFLLAVGVRRIDPRAGRFCLSNVRW